MGTKTPIEVLQALDADRQKMFDATEEQSSYCRIIIDPAVSS